MSETTKAKSYLDIVHECDSFPYIQEDVEAYKKYVSAFHAFKINGYPEIIGYMRNEIVEKFAWPEPTWKVVKGAEGKPGSITLMSPVGATAEERTKLINDTLQTARGTFDVIKGKSWRNEDYPIRIPGKEEVIGSMERAAACLFGIQTWGIHMTAYEVNDKGEYLLWVPERSKTKSTFPGMLDNSVAGGMSTGETPFKCMLREAEEEASLPNEVAKNAIATGALRYIYERDANAGGETGLLQPECEYIYDLKLPAGVELRPNDNEAVNFLLMSIEEVITKLKEGKFKPNCGIVIVDFLVRHGFITQEGEDDYEEICSRMHRKLGYPNL
ncbi:hypothetical protein EMPG_12420 [Blastomyces silverae]|uniref:Nudix hydrolase domain-containing protein n=1 Tax=Blastomyces silverae TaxID=2060906 RepID=A0A0H1BLZ5_9EURO|nr:hypothetical protein EMPG_12420 [Blastomyces silverae]